MWWKTAFSFLTEGVSGYFKHRRAKTEAKRDVELKRIGTDGETDAVSAGDMQTSWKDEYLTVLLTIPVAVVFHASVWGDPSDIKRVKDAFAAMNELPDWYQFLLGGVVIGTFGLRTLAKLRKG